MKVLLFGASVGGQNFIKNHGQNYNFLAIIDNDTSKHGLVLNNIEIISPEKIKLYDYDKIVVTSMYVDSISSQLQMLGVPKEKIQFASKNSMKVDKLPFENEETLTKANDLIVSISNTLKDLPHFYTFGTLLGVARDGNLIPWDDDIDIAIFAEDIKQVREVLLNNIRDFEKLFDVKLYSRIYSNGNPASITLDCLENGRKLFMVNFDCMHIEGDWVKQELNDTPLEYFIGYEELDFANTTIRVPKNYKSYLDFTYGDWHTVKKNTSFADNTVSFREPLYSCTIEYLYESK